MRYDYEAEDILSRHSPESTVKNTLESNDALYVEVEERFRSLMGNPYPLKGYG